MSEILVADSLMESFVIEGSRPLRGSIRATGNKNAALPIIAAALLTDELVTLTNVPAIRDVETMLELVADLGVEVESPGGGVVRILAEDVRKHELDAELCTRIRASILLAGPLLARWGEAIVPPPGAAAGGVAAATGSDMSALRAIVTVTTPIASSAEKFLFTMKPPMA